MIRLMAVFARVNVASTLKGLVPRRLYDSVEQKDRGAISTGDEVAD